MVLYCLSSSEQWWHVVVTVVLLAQQLGTATWYVELLVLLSTAAA
jgi:hypothetical protein